MLRLLALQRRRISRRGFLTLRRLLGELSSVSGLRVRLRHNMEWHEGRLADVYTFRNGKAIQMRAFADRRQALEWVGVKTSDAN